MFLLQRWVPAVWLASLGCQSSLWTVALDGHLEQDGIEVSSVKGKDRDYIRTSWLLVPLSRNDDDNYVEFELVDHMSLVGSDVSHLDPIRDLGIKKLKIDGVAYKALSAAPMEARTVKSHGFQSSALERRLEGWLEVQFESGFTLFADMEMWGFREPNCFWDGECDEDNPGGGSGGSGGDCDSFADFYTYYDDVQVNSVCLSAGKAEACDDSAAKQYSCDQISDWAEASLGPCPYCP